MKDCIESLYETLVKTQGTTEGFRVSKCQASRGAYSAKRYLYNNIQIDPDRVIASSSEITEGVKERFTPSESGGMIVCSTDINAVKLSSNKIVNWIEQKVATLSNRIVARQKIAKVADADGIYGWTVGRGLKGSYHADNGKIYSESSLSIEVVGVDTDTLIKLAEDLCEKFKQEAVMVKDYNTHSIYFIESDSIVQAQKSIQESTAKYSDAERLIEFLQTLDYSELVKLATENDGTYNDYRVFGDWECYFGVDLPILNMTYRVYIDVFYKDGYFGQSVDIESQPELKHKIGKIISKIQNI